MTDRYRFRLTSIALLAVLLAAWASLGPRVATSETNSHRPNPLLPVLGEGGIRLASTGPELAVPNQVPAEAGSTVTVPVTLTPHGNAIASLVFSVDYDEAWLSFDPTDSDADGIPDAVTFNTPAAFSTSATFDAGDTDSEIDVFVADLATPLASLPDGNVLSITFTAGLPTVSNEVAVNFSQAPVASFSTPAGESAPGTTSNGSVVVSCPSFVVSPVSEADVQALAAKWHLDPQEGDLDGDEDADVVDVMRLATWWGRSCN